MLLFLPLIASGQLSTQDTDSTSLAESSTLDEEGTNEANILQEPEKTQVCKMMILLHINMILVPPFWLGCN